MLVIMAIGKELQATQYRGRPAEESVKIINVLLIRYTMELAAFVFLGTIPLMEQHVENAQKEHHGMELLAHNQEPVPMALNGIKDLEDVY